MANNRTKRRRIRVRSVEERMSDTIMALKNVNPKQAWREVKFMELSRNLKTA